MTTTHLFVELLVIGFGASVWLVLLGLAMFGPLPEEWLKTFSSSFTLVFPALSVVYVMGILVDRMADRAFSFWDKKHYSQKFDDKDLYYHRRRTMVFYGRGLWEHLEYGRSRLRICRGWTLNALLTLVMLDYLFFFADFSFPLGGWQIFFCNLLLILFCWLCYDSWSNLNRTEYTKISRQAPWIARMEKIEGNIDEQHEGPGPEPKQPPVQD